MKETNWLKFWLTAFNPVFYEGKPYADMELFSKEEFPFLRLMDEYDLSDLEMLLVAKLVVNRKTFGADEEFNSLK